MMSISCQNGCDAFIIQFLRKPVILVKELATGETRAFCFKCVSTKMSTEIKKSDWDTDVPVQPENILQCIELKPQFVWG